MNRALRGRLPVARIAAGSTAVIGIFFWIMQVVQAAPIPQVSFINVDSTPLVGQPSSFRLQFDNSGDAVGYGPYIDLILPEYITLATATYAGTPIPNATTAVGPFPAGAPSCVTHPFARGSDGQLQQVCLSSNPGPNTYLHSMKLPFGSFADHQTAADVQVTVNIDPNAPIGVAKTITTQAGFYLGNDPLDNPTTDPSYHSSPVTTTMTPTVVKITKTYVDDYLKDDHTIVPGSNNKQKFRIVANVANGATITNLQLADVLQSPFIVDAIQAITPGTGTNNSSGQTAEVEWATIVGTASASDASFDVQFEVPYRSGGNLVLGGANGYDVTVPNQATVDGTYNSTPIPTGTAQLDGDMHIKPLITRKDVAAVTGSLNDLVPGEEVEYTIESYLSDYEAIQNFNVTDVLPDGMSFSAGTAVYSITQNGGTSADTPITPSETPGPGAGQTSLGFDLSSEGQLLGGCVPAGGTGGPDPDCGAHNDGRTSIKIVFRAQIDDQYSNGDKVNDGDTLNNSATSAAGLLDNGTLAPTATNVGDANSAPITLAKRNIGKTVYAVNGSTSLPTRFAPGDVITYRLRYDVPSTDFTALKIDDYLPLPMFDHTEVSTTFDTTISADVPAAGTAKFGPNETLYSFNNTMPTVTHEDGNVVRFTWPETHDPSNADRHIDILFSVTIGDEAYAPGLFVTNQATSTEGDTGDPFTSTSVHHIELQTPQPVVTKGVVASDNSAAVFAPATVGPVAFTPPGSAGLRFTPPIDSTNLAAQPINSDVSSIDAADKATFAIVMENKGDGDLFNARFKDVLPANMSIPAGGANIHVSNGAGTALGFTDLGGGLFGTGIELNDPVDDKNTVTPGANIVVITFDLEVDETADAGEVLTNMGDLTQFAAEDGGVNYMNNQPSYQDPATVTITNASMDKEITDTNVPNVPEHEVVIGEQVTYTATLTVPEGTMPNVEIEDTLPSCLAIAYLDSLTASPGVASSVGPMADVLTNALIGANGQSVTLNLGTVTNSNTSNGTAETITLVYRVVPLNAPSCIRGHVLTNNIVATWDGGTASDSTNATIIEPSTTVTKAFIPSTGDGGDTVTVRLTVHTTAGTNHADAYNVSISDDLNPTNFTYAGNLVHTGAGTAPTTLQETGGVITATWDTLSISSGPTVIEFDVQVKDTVVQGSQNHNSATVRYTSFPGTPDANQDTNNPLACERTGNTGDCGGAANTYHHTSNPAFTVNSISEMTKAVVATSEAFTTGSNVAIGEIVRYRLTARIPEGTNPQTVFRDALPDGLQFLNDSTAKAALVSTSTSAMTSSTMNGAGLNVAGDQTTVGSITPTFTIPGSAIVGGPFNSGTDVDFNFGTIVNSDNDANSEYIVVEFNALVNNLALPGNLRGTNLANQLTVRQGGSTVGSSPAVNVTIQEPNVSITKTVTTAPVDAGDPVAYGITITNTGATNLTNGYDWEFSDTLDQYLTYQSVTSMVAPGYAGTPTVQNTNNDVTVTFSELRPNDSVTFTINATVNGNAPADYTVPNTGTATTTSLPGPQGTTSNPTGSSTPGNTGDVNGERQRDGDDSADTTLSVPLINKQAPTGGSTTSIGDTVTFPIEITVPQGVVLNAVLTDNIPAGMQYMSHSIDTTGFTGSFANNPPIATPPSGPGTDGQDISLNFGNITTPGNPGQYSSFTVNVTVRIMNDNTTQIGSSLINSATLSYTDPNPPGGTKQVNSGNVPINIAEPELTLTKNIAGADPRDVGQTLTFTVDMDNTGDSTAYEWVMTDQLAEHTTLSGTPTCTKDSNPLTISHNVNAGVLTINENPLANSSLAVGGNIECTYSVTIGVSAVIGSTYINTADVDWWSAPSAGNPQARHYNDTFPYTVDGTQDTDTAQFTIESASLHKTDGGITDATIGQIVTYTITVQMPEGTVDDFGVSDTLPAGLIYVDNPSITGAPTVTPTVSSPNDGSAPVTVDWNFGTLEDDQPHRVTIVYRARVANVAANQEGVTMTNNADLTFTPEGGSPVNLNDSDTFDVAEPKLDINKTADKTAANYGTIVNYTITINHDIDSTADANNLSVADTMPSGMTLVAGSVQSTDPTWNIVEGSNGFTATKPAYALGAPATVITYQARMNAPPGAPTLGSNQDNTVSLDWTSLPGANTDGRDGSGGVNDYSNNDNHSVTADAIDLAITKSDGGGPYNPGDTIPYDLEVQNLGNTTANTITVTETVPANTTFNAAASTAGWSCANGSASGTTCTLQIASLGASASTNVTFAVDILGYDAIDPSASQIQNTASVAGDPSNGTEVTNGNNTDNEPSPLDISDLTIVKDETIDPVFGLDKDFEYKVTVTNNGPDTATNVDVHDTVPDGISINNVTTDDPAMSCGFVDQNVDCTMASMTNGQSVVITIAVTGDTPGNKLNTASVRGDQQDPNRGNNSDTEGTLVDPADIVLKKSVDNARPAVGQTVTFTIDVTNNGPDHATNLVVTDNMPAMFQVLETTPAQGSCSGTSPIICNLGTLNNGAHTKITIKAKVLNAGTATNTVSSTLYEYDPDPTNSTNIGVDVSATPSLADTGSSLIAALLAAGLMLGITLRLIRHSRAEHHTT